MPRVPALGLGRKGLHVPCVFWPSTYAPQVFEYVAASHDGRIIAASCYSGQVYIWHCAHHPRGGNLRLDPSAVVLGGWLGPAKILAIDFCCLEQASAELAGLTSGLLLVCVLPGGQLRLLDTTDGRCVAKISARPGSTQSPNMIARVLADGRHLVLGGCGSEVVVVDLWPGRTVAKLQVPSSHSLLRLATSKHTCPFSGSFEHGNASSCVVSAASSDAVFVWRWSGSSEENVKDFFSFNYTRNVGRHKGELIGLSLEGGVLLLGLSECLLLWRLHKDGAGPCAQVHFPSGLTIRTLVGSCLLQTGDFDSPNRVSFSPRSTRHHHRHRNSHARASSVSDADLHVARPDPRKDPKLVGGRLYIVAWTVKGDILRCDAGDDVLENRNLVSETWATLPRASKYTQASFFNFGPLLVGCVPSELGDSLHLSVLQTDPLRSTKRMATGVWGRAASLEELWQPSASRYGASIKCAAVVENHQGSWLALGLSGKPGKVCAISLGTDNASSQQPKSSTDEIQFLPLPDGFEEPTCLLPLGAAYLAIGDSRGLVCGWSLADWRMINIPPPAYRVAIVSLAQVWSPRSDAAGDSEEPLVAEVGMVAALNELGRCRVINLRAGEVMCSLQSQLQAEQWFDEPFRITYDRVSRYLFTAIPGVTSVWDAGSGAFMGNSAIGGPENVDSGVSASHDLEKSIEGSTPGIRCPTLENPSFGIDAVSWQIPSAPNDAPLPMWRFGEVFLDGPFWRLPVVLFSPSQLVAKLAGSSNRSAGSSSSPSTAAVAPAETDKTSSVTAQVNLKEGESISGGLPLAAGDPLASVLASECNAQFISGLQTRLRCIGVRLSGPLCVVGVLGVDDSISFPLPRRRGITQRSLSPPRERTKKSTRAIDRGNGRSAAVHGAAAQQEMCTAAMSQELLQGSLFNSAEAPQIAFSVIMRLLMHSEVAAAPQVFQRWVLPRLRQILRNASLPCLMRLLDGWAKILNKDVSSARASTATGSSSPASLGSPLPTDAVLRHCGFGSAALLKDAATMMLALAAHFEPVLFNKFCPPRTAASVAEGLCLRMFTRLGGMQLQSISCEVLALGFPIWRKHLATALPKRPDALNRSSNSGTTAPGSLSGSSSGRTSQLAPPTGRGAEAACTPSPEASSGLPDADLEWLTVQVLALYQEPRVAPSCLAVMMQVGIADSGTLLHVMGKAARRLDLGASYASSALLVLVSFVHRSPAKVISLLPKFTEAVLRCLEPSDPALRRQSLLAVTSALHELVQTYPMVSFHQPSQKFAVGTGDGLVVVYDLRTATKWRILEGHTGPISAIAFSRDGNNLSSYSVQDSTIRLWQCSSNGFLGGLLGSSGRCLKQHGLPPSAPYTPTSDTWRIINLSWTERGHLRLLREDGQTIHLKPD